MQVLVLLQEQGGARLLRMGMANPALLAAAAARAESGAADFPWQIVAGPGVASFYARPLALTQKVDIEFCQAVVDDLSVLGGLPCQTDITLSLSGSLNAGHTPGPNAAVAHRVGLGFAKGCPHLKSLTIYDYTSALDCAPLAGLRFLTCLKLKGCTGLTDLTALAESRIEQLSLVGCTGLKDLTVS